MRMRMCSFARDALPVHDHRHVGGRRRLDGQLLVPALAVLVKLAEDREGGARRAEAMSQRMPDRPPESVRQ